jgi:hypothetical protein
MTDLVKGSPCAVARPANKMQIPDMTANMFFITGIGLTYINELHALKVWSGVVFQSSNGIN